MRTPLPRAHLQRARRRPPCHWVLALAGLLLALAPASAQERILPFAHTLDRLDNGLTVVTVPTNAKGIIAYYSVVRTGSMDEVEEGKTGFAHFFEHMMFRGTEKYDPKAYSAVLQGHGADANAYTTSDYTAYYIVAPKSALDDIIDLESDRFMHLKYKEDDFKTEAGAVLGEYNKAYHSPRMKMWEAISETAFDAHTYKHTTIGYLDDIKAMPEGFEYSLNFFKRHYTPDNTTLIVAGDIDRDTLLPKVKAAYDVWKGTHDAPKVTAEPAQAEPKKRHLSWPRATAPLITVAWKTPAFSTASTDTAALEVAAALLFGETSPLYQDLVLKEQLAVSLSHSGDWHHRDPHLLMVQVRLKDPAAIDGIVERIQAEATKLAEGQVDAERLASVKSHTRYGQLMGLETPNQIAQHLAAIFGVAGDVAAAEGHLAQIAKVQAADLQRVASTYLVPKGSTVITLSHTPEAEEASK
ncbi:MAG: M16 family metallopeptidase [Bradymonadia bacterium]